MLVKIPVIAMALPLFMVGLELAQHIIAVSLIPPTNVTSMAMTKACILNMERTFRKKSGAHSPSSQIQHNKMIVRRMSAD